MLSSESARLVVALQMSFAIIFPLQTLLQNGISESPSKASKNTLQSTLVNLS